MWRKIPRVHHRHNPRLERQSTCGSFWWWRGDCANRIKGYRRWQFRRLEEPSWPLGLSLSTHQRTLQSCVPGWWNGLRLQPLGAEAKKERDLESDRVVAGIVPMMSVRISALKSYCMMLYMILCVTLCMTWCMT